jgi:8-oxo-dGTP pyrophosphatase MutT (NUDIX family)
MNTFYKVPISVKGIVIEDKSVWLRQNEHGEWELPGGKMDPGEQPEATVIRELMEELGFEVRVDKLISAHMLGGIRTHDEINGVLILIYSCQLIAKAGEFETEGEAGTAQYQKFPLEEISQLNTLPLYVDAITQSSTI